MVKGFARSAAVLAIAGVLGSAAAWADDAAPAVKHDAASNNNVVGAGSGSGGGSPNTIVDPANGGVAGTGLGTVPKGSKGGTGNSVKGPAGQGVSNSTDNPKP